MGFDGAQWQSRVVVDIVEHDGVTQWRFASVASRLTGYSASAFLTADGVLIDSGIPACAKEFERLLDATAIRGAIITHHHEDHAGNIEMVARRGIPVWVAPLTVPLVTTPAPTGAYRRLTWRAMRPLTSAVTPFAPDSLTPIAAPGHCADHHIVWHPASRTLFSADLFLGVAVRIAHHDEDLWLGLESLDAAAALEPARMFCAHRGFVPDPVLALKAKATWTREMIDSIAARIGRGETDAQILASLMGGESVTGWASVGEYSRRNFIRSVRARVSA